MIDNKLNDALTAIGAVIEIASFVKKQMMAEGFSEEEASSTAQKYILQALVGNKSHD